MVADDVTNATLGIVALYRGFTGMVIDRHYFPAELTKAIEDFLFVEVETEVRLDF